MIHSGEIAIGKPIVLIEYYVITVNDGKLGCVELILPKYKKLKMHYVLLHVVATEHRSFIIRLLDENNSWSVG